MYYGLFECIMYDSHGLELCTMHDSYGIYLCVLLTNCMYKFSRCHAIIFHNFFVPFTDFRQKNHSEIVTPISWQNRPIYH
jgi:hypothetical protein